MFSKNTLLNFFITSFIISILVNNYLQDFLLSFFIILFFWLIYFNLFLYKKSLKKYLILFIFIFIWSIIWIFVSNLHLEKINKSEHLLEKHYLTKFDYEFKVKDLYKKYEFYNTYIVQIYKISWSIVDKKIYWIVYIPNNLTLLKWEIISTNSQIINIDNVDNSFNYKRFLLSKNIYFKSYLYNFKIINRDDNFLISLSNLRLKILDIINKIYPNDEAIFLSWILIWARENIPKSLSESFNNSWTTHLVAVSWFNITILIIFLWFFLRFLPLLLRTISIISFLIIFCLFVWLEASVVRAWIMWILWYLVMISWRNNNSLTILLLTSFFMILYNPFYINYDVSFQLSFLAVFWILYTKDFFDRVFAFLPNLLSIKESFVLTLSAMVFTLPIMIFNFWQISLLAPISNIAIVWNIPLVMLIGFLSVIWYYFSSIIWIIIWFFAFILLKWDIVVIKFFWGLENFILKTDFWDYALYLELIYFIFLVFIIVQLNKKRD